MHHAGLVRAKLAADKPTEQSNHDQPATKNASSSAGPGSSCPFLNAINATPPEVHIPWYKRLQQYSNPWEFQQLVLDDVVAQGHQIAALTKTMGFTDAFMPASGDAVRTVFAGEAGSDPITSHTKSRLLSGWET